MNLIRKKTIKAVDTTYTQNRELSWLNFNERVLEEALDTHVPLLERLKFVEIFTSNLDEFFMVRVGSLMDLQAVKPKIHDTKSDMTPAEQLSAIAERTHELYLKRDKVYEEVTGKLAAAGIKLYTDFRDLSADDQAYFSDFFNEQILPILSPQILDSHHPFPHVENKEMFAAALLKYNYHLTIGMVPLPKSLPRYLSVPSGNHAYILLDEVIINFFKRIFSSYPIIDRGIFAITRNADVNPDDEEVEYGDDYLALMRRVLNKRKHMPPVRLEVQTRGDSLIAPYLAKRIELSSEQVYVTSAPLNLSFVYRLEGELDEESRRALCYKEFTPLSYKEKYGERSMLEVVRERDVLLSYPYEDFGIFLKLVKEAVYDEVVMSIKITIYRIGSGHVSLMNYLTLAAELGKEVTVLLELKARFDEANNMGWVDSLRDAGCHILYGFEGYKVHAKVCLITSRTDKGLNYITYVGTGNFNAKTARLYTDLALITASDDIGRDAAMFFRNMGISNLYGSYAELLVAPVSLKPRLLELIQQEIDKARRSEPAKIVLKMNSLTDRDLIDKLSAASSAGVEVQMIVRGICCLRPEIHDKTEHIHVRGIVGRFLEHPRVFAFGVGENTKVYIASADWMTRNTENRVEVACPIHDEMLKQRILDMLKLQLSDNLKAREIGSDGKYRKVKRDSLTGSPLDAQQEQIWAIEKKRF